ncbi:MAG: hypothetical protein HKN30_08805 [Sulfitobacter sp.]|nr:hypothetical protein [Sulfitobacter sp.]
MRLRVLCLPLAALTLCLAPLAATAQASTDQPLSVIDWLGTRSQPLRPSLGKTALPEEPAVAANALPPQVSVQPLGQGAPREIGLVPGTVTGLPGDIWTGSDPDTLITLIESLPDLQLPAARSLLYTVLLAEAQAPQGDAAAGEVLALARVKALMRRGAIDPALSLIEQAGVTKSPDHFDLWMEISLLAGTEDRACAVLTAAPHLTRDYGTRIFCAARARNWENAALTLGSAKALGLMPDWRLALMDRFLNPDFYEEAAPLPPPRKIDPLSFRLFEAIGEPLSTGNLPRAFAVADLRDLVGWKAQLEAAERLTRAGSLPDNSLLGLYTERRAAASGGVWDRVRALQDFDTALATGSAEAVTKTLPPVWQAMREAGLELVFVSLFAESLARIDLTGSAGEIARTIALLSPNYEAAARASGGASLPNQIALGEVTTNPPGEPREAAIHEAFTSARPRADLVVGAQQKRLGETILHLLHMLHQGAEGDPTALRDALATLRAIGLEDTARRAALQLLLLEG